MLSVLILLQAVMEIDGPGQVIEMEQSVVFRQSGFSQHIHADPVSGIIDPLGNDIAVCQVNMELVNILSVNVGIVFL